MNGYFWLPCPKCGEMFGGHEVIGAVTVPGKEPGGNRRVICPACELDAVTLVSSTRYEQETQ